MPTDYTSTARALSLPTSSPDTLSSSGDTRPPWGRSGSGRRDSSMLLSAREAATLRDQVIKQATGIWRRLGAAWRQMNFWQRLGVVGAAVILITLGVGFMMLTGRLFLWLAPVAEKLENSKLTALVLWVCLVIVAFPPLIGWSALATVCGFIFGLWTGWFLAASATVVGSTCSFIVSRTLLSKYVNRLMENDKKFAALALTLKYDGLKLLCMIRLCPMPYSICNGAVSTFPTVQPLMYALATAIITPKLLVPAFIGNRLRALLGKKEHMSVGVKAVNVISIFITVAIGIFTGLYIYKRTIARAKELEAKERADIRRSLQADHAARRPHRAFSDDPDVNAAATTIARDEEERIGVCIDNEEGDNLREDEEEGGGEHPSGRRKSRVGSPYRDEFTDNGSDVFNDGDGSDAETYGLHTHIQGGLESRF